MQAGTRERLNLAAELLPESAKAMHLDATPASTAGLRRRLSFDNVSSI